MITFRGKNKTMSNNIFWGILAVSILLIVILVENDKDAETKNIIKKYSHRNESHMRRLKKENNENDEIINSINDEINGRQLKKSGGTEKPIMYTYYNKKVEKMEDSVDDAEHEDMMGMWVWSWEDAGWEIRVLTDDDARKHPEYDKYEAMLSKLDISSYNHFCFHRWMAMSVVGGGWMSDYDTVPLHMDAGVVMKEQQERNSEGKFASYCHHVPCLLYGSAQEWDRLAAEIMSYVPKHEGEHYSDMKGLKDYITDHPDGIILENRIHGRYEVLPDGSIDCKSYEGKMAWHFSHYGAHMAIEEKIVVEPDPPPRSRAYYMRRFMKNWRFDCAYYE